MPDIFGELRSLTQETPSQEIFDGIWTLLRKQPVEKLEQEYLPYVMSHLHRWPIGLRKVAHREQIPFFRPGDHDPRLLTMLALIDTLHPTHHTNFGDAEAEHLAAHEHLQNIRVLQIDNPRWTTAGVRALVGSQGAANLRVLRLRNAMARPSPLVSNGRPMRHAGPVVASLNGGLGGYPSPCCCRS